ncbi:MAG: type II toxin-antitoxin system RelE/ParE family toxin [Planctomycetota bacterium]
MSYSVRIRPEAQLDFDEQLEHIAEGSFEGALRWEGAFRGTVRRLGENPHHFGPAHEEVVLRLGLRSAPFRTKYGNNYQIIYVIDGEIVSILRIRGQGQQDLTKSDLPSEH